MFSGLFCFNNVSTLPNQEYKLVGRVDTLNPYFLNKQSLLPEYLFVNCFAYKVFPDEDVKTHIS